MQQALQQVRIIHGGFIVSWFLFILLIKFVLPAAGTSPDVPEFLPIVFGILCISEIGIAMFLRARFIGGSESNLRGDPDNPAALAKWRMGNLLSFVFAETITLFGLCLKFIGFGWNIVGAFFAVGMIMLLLWTPRKIQPMRRGVR